MASLTDVFIAAMEGPVTSPFPDKKSYDNLRTMLVRKLRKYNELQSSLGLYADTYVKASWDEAKLLGTFQILDTESRIRKASYDLFDI